MNREEITKYYFVAFFCPLSPMLKPFPILLHKATSGAANESRVQTFENLISNLNSASLLYIIGISFDGDTGWLKYVIEMVNRLPKFRENTSCTLKRTYERHDEPDSNQQNQPVYITESNQLDLPLHKLVDYAGILPFEDVLHLMKCARYTIISKGTFKG